MHLRWPRADSTSRKPSVEVRLQQTVHRRLSLRQIKHLEIRRDFTYLLAQISNDLSGRFQTHGVLDDLLGAVYR